MSSPSHTPVSSTAACIDIVSPHPEVREPWLPEPEELPNTPWYEEKSSNLKLSDIAIIKEKGGTMDKFEVVLPHPDERAHRPPPGFHTFYMNQIEMGLRFPILRFISALCHHIKISPSQLAPNSYSFLLALAVLLCYHDLPLIPYVLMQLIQIKRLGSGKFYISHKGDHTFIKGNPSSHKGWMSRFFYIKCHSMRNPWRCEMHWRDNVFTLTPRTPDRAPSLTPFLEAMRGKSYNAPELIKEDPLCFFKFSRKGIELVGDLGIVVSCLGCVSILSRTPVSPELMFALFLRMQTSEWAIVWGGEMVKRLSRAHQKVKATRKNFDKALSQHVEAVARLEELEAQRAREIEEAKTQRESLEAELAAEKEAPRERSYGCRAGEGQYLGETRGRAPKKRGPRGVPEFRSNGYSEEEHPASFLDLQQALAKLGDEDDAEEEEEEQEEGEVGDDAETNPLNSPKP
ncbi:hypothetical protein F511_25678 [Dorcoceras hygrometricum]|uniref:Uncharacterized protein n=1 Tax=Dorcoceras hygrometricum TaxID=472368 RepID=A0A2Z7AHJ1_9LAMI|nr:hypothetical protein F511_25678 [Dorcoceras hygrometricum]